jgi:hypothetical protein
MNTANNKKKMLRALKKNRGLVATSCNQVGISRPTHYNWYRDDIIYHNSVDEINEIELDGVESKLKDLIDGGNAAASIYYLRVKGASRGYNPALNIDAQVQGKLNVASIFTSDFMLNGEEEVDRLEGGDDINIIDKE